MKISFLGAGKMASALIEGLIRAGISTSTEICATSLPLDDAQRLASRLGIRVAYTNAETVEHSDIVLLCVKPADTSTALGACGASLANKLLISIAAGCTTASLEKSATGARVIRVMPNTAALVGRSATAIAGGKYATPSDLDTAEKIFSAVGKTFLVDESQINAVTGLSGSGPAFVYLVMEALSDGGVAAGLPRPLAQQLAIETVAGAATMATETGTHPAVLREMVTSPGGTTVAGLAVLEDSAVRDAFISAVRAAARRAAELE